MRVPALHRRSILIVATVTMAFALGVIAGFFIGQAKSSSVHAAGQYDLEIWHSTDLQSCTRSYGCANQTNVCHVEGTPNPPGYVNAIACHLALAPHDGGDIHEDGVPCLN